jgi:hypothetical protein
MALTCVCGKCDTSVIRDKAKVLEELFETTRREQEKASNLLWRSRIQKRIDELTEEHRKASWGTINTYVLEERIKELEGLLK